jgi:hypothetical protein
MKREYVEIEPKQTIAVCSVDDLASSMRGGHLDRSPELNFLQTIAYEEQNQKRKSILALLKTGLRRNRKLRNVPDIGIGSIFVGWNCHSSECSHMQDKQGACEKCGNDTAPYFNHTKPFITGYHGCKCHPFPSWDEAENAHRQKFKPNEKVKFRCPRHVEQYGNGEFEVVEDCGQY